MPGLNGMTTLKKISELTIIDNGKIIPAIVLSGDLINPEPDIGVFITLQKPISKTILIKAITEIKPLLNKN